MEILRYLGKLSWSMSVIKKSVDGSNEAWVCHPEEEAYFLRRRICETLLVKAMSDQFASS
jgi:hypothetical protein